MNTSAPGPAPPARRESPSPPCQLEQLPPEELIAGNMAQTELTALGEIVASGVDRPDAQGGYVNLGYEVHVLSTLVGSPGERIVLHQGVEAGFEPLPPGTLLFFSACRGQRDGEAYEPDVGYFFAVPPGCREQMEARARRATSEADPSVTPICAR